MNISEFEYIKLSDGSYKIIGYDGNNPDIVIPEGVSVIASSAFRNGWLLSLKLPSSLRRIGECAFEDSENMKRVDFSSCRMLEEIGPNAFAGSGIEELVIPESVKKIGYGAFCACVYLKKAYVPVGVKTMDWDIFADCYDLETITVGGDIPAAWDSRWHGSEARIVRTSGKTAPTLSGTAPVASRASDTSRNNAPVLKKAVPAAPKTAPVSQKAAPTAPGTVSLPKTVAPKTAPASPIKPQAERVKVENYTPLSKLITEPFKMGNIEGLMLVKPAVDNLTELILPPEIAVIGYDAFKYRGGSLTRFKAGKSLKMIFNNAFSGCPSLTEAEYDPATSVCEGAFAGTGLKKAVITNLAFDKAFRGSQVEEVSFVPSSWGGITEISNYVLSHTKIESIDLPLTVGSVGNGAFAFCERLKRVSGFDNVTYMASGVFQSCRSLSEFNMPGGVSGVPAHTFAFCDGLKRVSIADRPGEIGKMAFYKCDSLRELVIPSGIYRIGEAAVMCASLERIVFKGRTLDEVRRIFGFEWLVRTSPRVDIVCTDRTYTLGK